jgi:hypothetical protein
MTAAGASSLLVARDGLGALPPAAAAALDSSLVWIAKSFDRFFFAGSHPYYTLYSLEKVGDIGDIVAFGGLDWYREGATHLIRSQGSNGAWGDHIDTSFALLFLTRATRPALRSLPPPRVLTLAGGGGEGSGGDLVHVESLKGFISARDFFEYLQLTGDRTLLKVAAEVVRNYPLPRQGDLVPWLLPMWVDRAEGISAFVKKALEEITGESFKTAEEVRRWHEAYVGVRAGETGRDRDETRIAALLGSAPGAKLKARVLETIGRERLVGCVPAIIDAIPAGDGTFARRAIEILGRLTGAQSAGVEDLDRRDGRESAALAWRAIWGERGKGLLAAGRIRKLVGLLGPGEGPGRGNEDPLEAIVAEGRTAVPVLLEEMERDEYPAALVAALERISGRCLGLRPGPWKAWWENELQKK